MERVSNRFFAQLVKDGKSVSAVLRANTTLAQEVDQAGACTPNWNYGETGAETPIIWVLSKLSGREKAPTPASVVWKWNGNAITFDASTGKSNGSFVQTVNGTSYPMFEKTTVSENGVDMPALKILRNLASTANTDNDLITLEAELETAGVGLGFSISLPVRVQESAGNGWYGWLSGEPRVTTDVPSTVLTAKLKNGASTQQAFTAKFFREGIDTSSPLFTVSTQNGQAQATFTTSHITDYVVVRCEFYVGSVLVDTAFYGVDDETDEIELQVSSVTFFENTQIGTGQSDVIIRDDQEVLYTFWMGHRMNPENVDTRYTEFYVKLTNNKDQVISPSTYGSQLTDGQASGTLTTDANFRNVTVSGVTIATGVTAAKAGRLRLTAAFLESQGCGVGGVIMAK